jgi:hypothetical protein
VADQADAGVVDFGAGIQERDGCVDVGREVDRGCCSEVAGGITDTSLVIAHNGDAATVEGVGKNQENSVTENIFVPRVRA